MGNPGWIAVGLLIIILYFVLSQSPSSKETVVLAPSQEKDPDDHLYTPDNSTKWHLEQYCPECKQTVTYRNSVSVKCCEHCGLMTDWMSSFGERNHRKIFYKGKWQHQYRFNGNKKELRETEY